MYLYNKIEDVECDFVRVKHIAKKILENTLKDENLAKNTALRRMRLKAGLTQEQVAERINCNAKHYGRIELGEYQSSEIKTAAMALFEEILKGGKKC